MHTTRRQFIRRTLGGGAAALVAHHLRGAYTQAAEVPPSAPSEAGGRLNILFILPDQQRYDALGVVNSAVRTPNLDRLASEGVRFDLAYVAQALCTPSRGAIFSGLYPHTNGLQDNVYNVPYALADPREQTNIYGPQQADVIVRLLDEFDAWAQKTGDAVGLALSKECRANLKAPADPAVGHKVTAKGKLPGPPAGAFRHLGVSFDLPEKQVVSARRL